MAAINRVIYCLLLFNAGSGYTQGREQSPQFYQFRTVAFYNVENLFDTVNDSLVYDDERTPDGKDQWTEVRYNNKIKVIAEVLSAIGHNFMASSPDLIGLCEVENQKVLEDLLRHPSLRGADYRILHFDSPDERGIDVALLYKSASFIPIAFQSRRLLLFNDDGERNYTRDQLVVTGLLDDELIHMIINHWPSRSGGEIRSRPARMAAAELNRKIIDSISHLYASPKIISMGDFNDNPTDTSLKNVLKLRGNPMDVMPGDLFNPMEKLYRRGEGSLAYRDQWSLFDQIFFTAAFLYAATNSYTFWKVAIHKPQEIVTSSGNFKGYPLRTYANGNYTAGYSDHFPVYAYFIRKVETGRAESPR